MKKIYYVATILIMLVVSFIGMTYSMTYDDDSNLNFSLIGPSPLYVDVGSKYTEYGVKLVENGIDISDKVVIDSTNVDMNEMGEFKVKYQYKDEYIYRDVITIDRVKPTIKLMGGDTIYILLNGSYQEAGYEVIDNYDKDLTSRVHVEGSVDTSREGEYELKYSVTDNSANYSEVVRKVIVKKPVITMESSFNTIITPTVYNVTLFSNTIVKNKFYNYGIYYEGYFRNGGSNYKIKLISSDNKNEYTYNMDSLSGYYYGGNINLAMVENGVYSVYIIGNGEERLMNKLDVFSRIIRSKVGNKLATVSYDGDYVTITIEDFVYQYDVVIDPGHGGTDIGTANGILAEKDLNLMISKYEKCRYESMGYKVYMTRYNDTYGETIGNESLHPLDRLGLAIGYYGAVSRVTYSNHHNGSIHSGDGGFEMLVSNHLNAKELGTEINLYNKFSDFYNIHNDRIRMYSKDYDNDQIFNKSNGEVYPNKDYYSIIRIPYEVYNVKNVIFEPIFMTNPNDFNWYYSAGNWIKISEIKIEEYVTYMGGKYNPNNKKCL